MNSSNNKNYFLSFQFKKVYYVCDYINNKYN